MIKICALGRCSIECSGQRQGQDQLGGVDNLGARRKPRGSLGKCQL